MRILVTGGAGFIGSALVRYLVREVGVDVLNLDKLTYAGNLSNVASLEHDPRHIFVHGDICNTAHISRLLAEHRRARSCILLRRAM